MCSGAAQSGKPWPRFTAPYFTASRLISRMTDSVNDAALVDIRLFEIFGWIMLFHRNRSDAPRAISTRFRRSFQALQTAGPSRAPHAPFESRRRAPADRPLDVVRPRPEFRDR